MILSKQHIKHSIIMLLALFCFSCEKDPEQHLELGINSMTEISKSGEQIQHFRY